jgi:hypothetical protein
MFSIRSYGKEPGTWFLLPDIPAITGIIMGKTVDPWNE